MGSSKRTRDTEPAPQVATTEIVDFAIPPPADDAAASPKKSAKGKGKATAVVDESGDATMEGTAEEGNQVAENDDEVPAMSHKERRLAKRRKLAGLDDPAPSSGPGPAAGANGVAAEGGIAVGNTPAKSAHGIWVGNLAFKTTSKMLLAWFEQRGLKDVTRINMPNGKRVGESNRGFAYLDFPTETEVQIAVGLSEQHLEGRKLLIKNSSDFTGRPAPAALPTLDGIALTDASNSAPGAPQTLNKTARKILNRQKNPAGPTLFIGNLGFETTAEDIKGMFDAHQLSAQSWARKVKGAKEDKGEEEKSDDEAEGDEEEKKEDDGTDRDDDESEDEDEKEDEDEGEKSESDDEDEKPVKKAKKEKAPKGPKDLSKAKDAGIRKVRLGTFEDTGKCKGWAFVDFHLPEQCTRALLNIRNHTLNGRALNVEYASSDAVRRGQVGTRAAIKANRGGAGPGARGGRGRGDFGGGRGRGDRESAPRRQGRDWDDGERAGAGADEDAGKGESWKSYKEFMEEEGANLRESEAGASRGGRGRKRAGF
ncbi:RNA-binding protein Rnp24 [Pseudohyphozyma bogoriensis]|nr:RNA-binding protein Rnp24 [Pseudohyphozyma bogoriensis]